MSRQEYTPSSTSFMKDLVTAATSAANIAVEAARTSKNESKRCRLMVDELDDLDDKKTYVGKSIRTKDGVVDNRIAPKPDVVLILLREKINDWSRLVNENAEKMKKMYNVDGLEEKPDSYIHMLDKCYNEFQKYAELLDYANRKMKHLMLLKETKMNEALAQSADQLFDFLMSDEYKIPAVK